jgi:hypothetical protein
MVAELVAEGGGRPGAGAGAAGWRRPVRRRPRPGAAGWLLQYLLSCPAPYKSPLYVWGGSRHFLIKRGRYAQVMCLKRGDTLLLRPLIAMYSTHYLLF